jgi:hypothetical protein
MKKHMAQLLRAIILMMVSCISLCAIDEYDIPERVEKVLMNEAYKRYVPSPKMNPFYLRGDFDGDGPIDYAVWVRNKTNNKEGILFVLSSLKTPVIVAAGNRVVMEGGRSGDDFGSFNAWNVEDKKEAGYKGEPLHVVAKESASGLIVWTGRAFKWIQLGI